MRVAPRPTIFVLLFVVKGVASFVSPWQQQTGGYLRYYNPLGSSSGNSDEPQKTVLVNFDNGTDITTTMSFDDIQMDSINYGGYSLNGYTGTSFYKNSLSSGISPLSRNAALDLEEFNEDGYGDMRKRNKRTLLDNVVKFPFRVIRRISNGKKVKEPGALILVRHGESLWNQNKTFTGWSDPDLSADGVREVEHAARLLLEGGWEIDLVFTSRLKRAIRSAWIILAELQEVYLPVFKSWRLNER